MIIYEHTVPGVVIVGGAVLASVISALGYWLYVKRDWAAVVMVLLRIGFLGLLAWCMFMPGERTSQTLQQKARFIVLLDRSKSMTMTPVKDATNRWQVAVSALKQSWPTALAERCDIDCYSLDAELSDKLTLEELLAKHPEGNATLLRDALKEISSRYVGLDVAGCLLLSDGLDTREAFANWSLEKRPYPIHTLMLEKDAVWEEEPDVRVDTVNTPRRVTVGWQTDLKAAVSGQGTKGQSIKVKLFKDGVFMQ